MLVKQIMTKKVISVSPATTIGEVAALLVKNNIKGMPVIDKDRRVVGLITESDLVLQNAQFHVPTFIKLLDTSLKMTTQQKNEALRKMTSTPAGDVMSEHVITVDSNSKVGDLATIMWEKKVNPVPVLDNGQLVGIVSRTDIINLLAGI